MESRRKHPVRQMDKTQILAAFHNQVLLPKEAIEEARRQKSALIPVFVSIIRSHAACTAEDSDDFNLLFFAFHLLGEWREKSACQPILRFLRSPAAEQLGDCITETSHRVLAAVFDGEVAPLRELVLDRDADEYVRSRALEAMAMLARAGNPAGSDR